MSLAVAITKTGDVFSRQPGEEGAEHARGRPAVAAGRAARPAERLVDLVHPQDRRGDALGRLDRPPHVLLARADQAAEHPADVQPQQRQLPQARRRLGAQALAAPLHAQQQHAARGRQPELRGPVGERQPASSPATASGSPARRRSRGLSPLSKYSSRPLFLMICCFSLKTTDTSSASSLPSMTIVLAKTFSASFSVSPRAACSSRSRPSASRSILTCGLSFTSSMMRSSRRLKSGTPGRPYSRTVTSLPSSGAIRCSGETMTMVL